VLSRQGEWSSAREALAIVYHELVRQALTLSYLDGFRVMAVLLLATVPFVWIMKRPHFAQDAADVDGVLIRQAGTLDGVRERPTGAAG
jgi:hypothetical protein